MQEIATRYVNTWHYKTTNAYNFCTYLNSGLLEAPRKYVLHGLVPCLNWAPFWPLPMSMHLVATPSPVSCYRNGSSFTPCAFCYLGGFSLMYKKTSQQRYTTHGTHVYTSHRHYYSFLLSTHRPFFLAGGLSPTHRIGYSISSFSL